jgi:hypothetical protein
MYVVEITNEVTGTKGYFVADDVPEQILEHCTDQEMGLYEREKDAAHDAHHVEQTWDRCTARVVPLEAAKMGM